MNITISPVLYFIRTAVGGAFLSMALNIFAVAVAQDGEQSDSVDTLRIAPPDFLSSPSDALYGDVDSDFVMQYAYTDSSYPASLNDDPDAGFQPDADAAIDNYFRPVGYDPLDCRDDVADCSELFCNPCPCFYGLAEGLFLTRQPLHSRHPLINDQTTNATLLSTSNLNSNYSPGLRARVGYRLAGGNALEFS